jgi:hypothetical protein
MTTADNIAPTGHIIGATYLSRYWKQRYRVLREETTSIGSRGITVKWEDGRFTTHSTHVGDDRLLDFETV